MQIALAFATLILAQTAPVEPTGRPQTKVKPLGNPNAAVVFDLNGQIMQAPVEPMPLPSDADLSRIEVPADLVRLARQFDSDAFAERASAREQLVARKAPADELMALLLRRDLSNDARHAIVSVLEQRIMLAPRGALGIRMEGPIMRTTGVRVTGLVPGMPAERVLQVGDIISSVEGQPLLDRSDLVRAVQSLPPGVEVGLMVRRTKRDAKGKVMVGDDGLERVDELKLKLRLGSTEDLNERGDAQGGGVVNAMAPQRQAQIEEARRRFLPGATVVEFPNREQAAARAPVNPELLRKQLAALQLAGKDPELINGMRKRLELLIGRVMSNPDQSTREQVEAALEALATEIRGLR
jgi:hypothetical protein